MTCSPQTAGARPAVVVVPSRGVPPITEPSPGDSLHRSRWSGTRPSEGERRPPEPRPVRLLGASPAVQALVARLARIAPSNASVLLTGETGSGKEVAARRLHELSRRSRGPFVAVNCGAMPVALMESQLFGHERGSFTGAVGRHRGVFERAHGGTLFLDEITEMAPELQVKLLRILESGEVMRVGGERPVSVDVRTIAATNRPPMEAVTAGFLRIDLYYRLRVLHLEIPPLRDRGDDIVLLANAFLAQIGEEEHGAKTLSEESLEVLQAYRWPGNVRELRNVVHSGYLMAEGPVVTPAALPDRIEAPGGVKQHPGSSVLRVGIGTSLRELEQSLIARTLNHTRGNATRAAATLGIARKTLSRRMSQGMEE
jgi:two-component system, NtrC family, response regulator AtoC